MGIIFVGGLNVHHKTWLKHFACVTSEERSLFTFCPIACFEERVQRPTRNEHLLDLVFADLHTDVKCTVLLQPADHNCKLTTVSLEVPSVAEVQRECRQWAKADWKGMNKAFADTD